MGHSTRATTQSAIDEWNQAIAWDQQIDDWKKANPAEDDEFAWLGPPDSWLKANGIPTITEAGRFNTQVRRDGTAWRSLKLARPVGDDTHVIQCHQCGQLALVNHPLTNNGLCHDCRGTQLETRKVEQAAKRVERRQKRSEELRNRKGRCLVCGTEMTVARVTKTTCSDRCRKQWIRKGADAFPLPEVILNARMPDGTVIPIGEAAERVTEQALSYEHSLILKGQDRDDDQRLAQLKGQAKQLRRMAELAKLKEEAPAILLWELSQQEGSEGAQ